MSVRPNDDRSDKPREHCGVFGAYGIPDAAAHIYTGLFALQHRGQEGAGIVTADEEGKIRSVKGAGLLSEVFSTRSVTELPGHMGIGHVRYSTTGSPRPQNIQPLIVECIDGIWAIAHNGNLVNAKQIRRQYQEAGAIFQTSTDSEVLVHLIADPMYRSRPRRVERALAELQGAFSYLIMTKNSVMACRDRYGFRPLSIGKLGDGYVFASETCAINQIGAEYVRDVNPGELIVVDEKGFRSTTYCEPVKGSLGQCIFEHVYFSRPDSHVFGEDVQAVRVKLGKRLAQESPVEADLVISVPDSGTAAALGYAQESGIRFDYGFIRNHYIGRTFIMPESAERGTSVDMKLSVVPGVVAGKRIVVVDDSIIRGTTSKRRVQALREAGAKEIHMRISCPPTINPCYFGIDFPDRSQLLAAQHNLDQIRDYIGADTVAYVSLEGLLSTVGTPDDYCTGCFSGKYPMDGPLEHTKEALEASASFSV